MRIRLVLSSQMPISKTMLMNSSIKTKMRSLLRDTPSISVIIPLEISLYLNIHIGDYLKRIREKLPFADGGSVIKIFNSSIEALLGPKTEQDTKAKVKAPAPAKKKEVAEETKKEEVEEEEDLKREKLSKLVGNSSYKILMC